MPEALVLREEEGPAVAWLVQGESPTIEAVLGFAVPAAHRWLEQGGWTACWIGPSAWHITHAGPIGDYERRRDALIAAGGALFDVSDARAAIRVAGAGARKLLASGCGIDFDAAAFPAGECRSTLFARIGVLIVKHDETPSYTLFVPRSYAASLLGWLELSCVHSPSL